MTRKVQIQDGVQGNSTFTLTFKDARTERIFGLNTSFNCDICGKRKGRLKHQVPIDHSHCSKIRQQRYRDEVERRLMSMLFPGISNG